MTIASPVFTLRPSTSILTPDGRTPVLAPYYKDPIDNQNDANGVVVADNNGDIIVRAVIPRHDTAQISMRLC